MKAEYLVHGGYYMLTYPYKKGGIKQNVGRYDAITGMIVTMHGRYFIRRNDVNDDVYANIFGHHDRMAKVEPIMLNKPLRKLVAKAVYKRDDELPESWEGVSLTTLQLCNRELFFNDEKLNEGILKAEFSLHPLLDEMLAERYE